VQGHRAGIRERQRPGRTFLVGAVLVALSIGCGSSEQTQPPAASKQPQTPITATSGEVPTPGRDPGNVNCSTAAGSTTGLTKFGAKIGAWNATHERDPQYLEWGPLLADGRRTYPTVRCSTSGRVIVIARHIYPPVVADAAVTLAVAELPSDAKLVYDFMQAQCRNLQYRSLNLAAEMGADNPQGIADVQLESPIVGADASFHPDNVDTASVDLLDAYGVKPTVC
jgi:hypothetical protein